MAWVPMPANGKHTVVGEVVAAKSWADSSSDVFEWSARCLRNDGVDLVAATRGQLARGTPVYVEASADVLQVQRLMATNHIRSVPVLDNGSVVGVVDLVELALMTDATEDGPAGA
jgi:CBS domain-containing protein